MHRGKLCEGAGPEHLGETLFGVLGLGIDGRLEPAPLRRESDDAGTPIGRVGLADDIPPGFEVTQQIVDRLLRDLELGGELRGRSPSKLGWRKNATWAGFRSSYPASKTPE